jgi:hypothetical protein
VAVEEQQMAEKPVKSNRQQIERRNRLPKDGGGNENTEIDGQRRHQSAEKTELKMKRRRK